MTPRAGRSGVGAALAAVLLATVAGAMAAPDSAPDSATNRAPAGSDTSAATPAMVPVSPEAAVFRLRETQRLESSDSAVIVEPSGVLADAFGRVWASDATLNVLRRWEASGRRLDETGTLGSEPGRFRRPGTLARLGSLGVAVLDTENQRVVSYDHQLRVLGVLVDLAAPALEARIGRVRPLGIASDRGGAMHVVDADRDRILVFDFAGTYLREIGGFGSRAGGFAGLMAVACDPHGNLVTVERPRARPRKGVAADTVVGRARVQWLEPGGRVLAARWTPVWSAGGSEAAMSLAVDDSGRVAVAGQRSGQLFVFGRDGTLLVQLAGLGSPSALGFAPDGTLLVAEPASALVRRFALERVLRD